VGAVGGGLPSTFCCSLHWKEDAKNWKITWYISIHGILMTWKVYSGDLHLCWAAVFGGDYPFIHWLTLCRGGGVAGGTPLCI